MDRDELLFKGAIDSAVVRAFIRAVRASRTGSLVVTMRVNGLYIEDNDEPDRTVPASDRGKNLGMDFASALRRYLGEREVPNETP